MAKYEVSEDAIQLMSVRMLSAPRYQREAALRANFGDDQQLANGRHMIRVSLREALTTFRASYPRATQQETIQALRDFIEAQPTRRRRAMERDLLAFAFDAAIMMLDTEERDEAHAALSHAVIVGEGASEAVGRLLKTRILLPREE